MKKIIYKSTSLITFYLLFCLFILSLLCGTGFALDAHKIFFASDSGSTWCRDSSSGPDLYPYSLFSLLKAGPPPGFTLLPAQNLPSEGPCGNAKPNINGFGGLKILDWYTACNDSAGNGICSWSCSECGAASNCPIYRNHNLIEQDEDWCCCASRRACLDQMDAKYVLLELVANDLWHVYNFYNRDVDLVVDKAKALTTYLKNQGRTVIWLSYCPLGYGSLGGGEKNCTSWLNCLNAINSNTEYFWSKFIPWLNTQQNVYFIDFFSYVKTTYGANDNFINQYGFDDIHMKPSGHQIYYDYVYAELAQILGTTSTTTTSITTTTTSIIPTTTSSNIPTTTTTSILPTTTSSEPTTTTTVLPTTTTSSIQPTTTTSVLPTTTTTTAVVSTTTTSVQTTTTTTSVVPTTTTSVQTTTTTSIVITTTTTMIDSDGDGITDISDNCPNKPNGPNLGTCSSASDKPGINCTSDADCADGCSSNGLCIKDQRDTDVDGVGDVCDNCPTNCNSQQLDADMDGIGDVCDTDPECGEGCTQPACEQACGT